MNPYAEREMRLYHAMLQYKEMQAVYVMWHRAYAAWDNWEWENENV